MLGALVAPIDRCFTLERLFVQPLPCINIYRSLCIFWSILKDLHDISAAVPLSMQTSPLRPVSAILTLGTVEVVVAFVLK